MCQFFNATLFKCQRALKISIYLLFPDRKEIYLIEISLQSEELGAGEENTFCVWRQGSWSWGSLGASPVLLTSLHSRGLPICAHTGDTVVPLLSCRLPSRDRSDRSDGLPPGSGFQQEGNPFSPVSTNPPILNNILSPHLHPLGYSSV